MGNFKLTVFDPPYVRNRLQTAVSLLVETDKYLEIKQLHLNYLAICHLRLSFRLRWLQSFAGRLVWLSIKARVFFFFRRDWSKVSRMLLGNSLLQRRRHSKHIRTKLQLSTGCICSRLLSAFNCSFFLWICDSLDLTAAHTCSVVSFIGRCWCAIIRQVL